MPAPLDNKLVGERAIFSLHRPAVFSRPMIADAALLQTRTSDRPVRIQGLDLIRAFAVGLVMLRHAWPSAFGGAGVVGVVIFFTLSGYLITGALLTDFTKGGDVSYLRFYRNRVLRLYPPLVLLVLVFAAVTVIWDPQGEKTALARAVTIALTYVSDWPHINTGTSVLPHLWTLSAEEQFYLLWPALLSAGLRFRLVNAILLLTGLSIYGICAWTLNGAANPADIYGWPCSWTIVMVIGAAARLYERRMASWLPAWGVAPALLPLAVLGVLLLIAIGPEAKTNPYAYLVGGPLIGLSTVILIFWFRTMKTVPRGVVPRALLFLGTVSYAAYLWDFPIVSWLGAAWGNTPLAASLSVPLTILAASLSWVLIERPIARWRAHRGRTTDGQWVRRCQRESA